MELLWLFGPPQHEIEPDVEVNWKKMHCEIALKVEAAFDSGHTHLYSVIDGYLYDFCSMTQLNMKFFSYLKIFLSYLWIGKYIRLNSDKINKNIKVEPKK
mgnify:CR=1 FL=1